MSERLQGIRDLIARIEAGLRARSEGSSGAYPQYEEDRKALLEISELRGFIPQFILDSPDVEIAFGHMRNHASRTGSWAGRREYVAESFSAARKQLKAVESHAPMLSATAIESVSIPSVTAQLTRAKALIGTDSASAVTKSETSLAGVCKHIILCEKMAMGKTDTLPSLVRTVAREILGLDRVFDVQSFSGISNQAQMIAEIRNRYGDAHPAPAPDDTLAEFAVSIAGNLAIFLLRRYELKSRGDV